MNNLMETSGSSYITTKGKEFKSEFILTSALEEAFEFAYSKTVGKKRNLLSVFWGAKHRENVAEFTKAFRGKLCEIGLKKYFATNGLSVRLPKSTNWEIDKFENFDLLVNGRRILVKAIPYYSNLLLLDRKLWKGDASYGKSSRHRIKYDYIVLTRLRPGVIHLFENFKLTKDTEMDKERIKQIVFAPNFQFEVTGYLSQYDLKYLDDTKQVLLQGSVVNGNKTLEHDYYYCQAGDLNRPQLLVNLIKYAD